MSRAHSDGAEMLKGVTYLHLEDLAQDLLCLEHYNNACEIMDKTPHLAEHALILLAKAAYIRETKNILMVRVCPILSPSSCAACSFP